LIRNRAFQGSRVHPSTIEPWAAVGHAALALDTASPLSAALPTSLSVTAEGDGVVGIKNPGWWGISVRASNTYAGSFYSSGAYGGNFSALLVSDTSGETLASTEITSRSTSGSWTQHSFELVPASDAANINNSFVLQYGAVSGETLRFNLVSLFPPTYNNR